MGAVLPGRELVKGERRRAQRAGREKGLRVFVPAEALALAGIDPDGPPPLYSVQPVHEEPGRKRRSVIVRLYPEG